MPVLDLTTSLQGDFFEILDHFWPFRKKWAAAASKITLYRKKDKGIFCTRHFVILGPSEPPHPPPPPAPTIINRSLLDPSMEDTPQ